MSGITSFGWAVSSTVSRLKHRSCARSPTVRVLAVARAGDGFGLPVPTDARVALPGHGYARPDRGGRPHPAGAGEPYAAPIRVPSSGVPSSSGHARAPGPPARDLRLEPEVDHGSIRQWRIHKMWVLREQPLCPRSGEAGKVVPATEVDHVIPVSQGGTDDYDNLASTWAYHHRLKLPGEALAGKRQRWLGGSTTSSS